jgi:hypothetical protein
LWKWHAKVGTNRSYGAALTLVLTCLVLIQAWGTQSEIVETFRRTVCASRTTNNFTTYAEATNWAHAIVKQHSLSCVVDTVVRSSDIHASRGLRRRETKDCILRKEDSLRNLRPKSTAQGSGIEKVGACQKHWSIAYVKTEIW